MYETSTLGNKFCDLKTLPRSIMSTKIAKDWGPPVGNLEVIQTGTSVLYDWDILGSSIYIVDMLRIDDQSSILRSLIYRVIKYTEGKEK